MEQEKYLTRFNQILEEMFETTRKKNTDYAGLKDAFANFRMIENITSGKVSSEEGILVRMTDKIQRVSNLLQREALVADEKITDTLTDLAVYSIILRIYLEDKTTPTVMNGYIMADCVNKK